MLVPACSSCNEQTNLCSMATDKVVRGMSKMFTRHVLCWRPVTLLLCTYANRRTIHGIQRRYQTARSGTLSPNAETLNNAIGKPNLQAVQKLTANSHTKTSRLCRGSHYYNRLNSIWEGAFH